MTLAYDGSAYEGWERRPGGAGVQNAVETALAKIFRSELQVQAASRTDRGVHALGQVVHFDLPQGAREMTAGQVLLAVNALLPEDVRVLAAEGVDEVFHARFGSLGKEYRYRIWNHPAMNPLLRTQAWHVPGGLDPNAMATAAGILVGRHDFRAFTSRRDGVLGDSVRTLIACRVEQNGNEWTCILRGEGFLYKMCRGIVGTLVQVGLGRFQAADIARLLESRDRREAGVNAPACGLVLQRVFYPGDEE